MPEREQKPTAPTSVLNVWQRGWTRLRPTLNNSDEKQEHRCVHAGHWGMAAHNVAAGRDEGIILGLEDETAIRSGSATLEDTKLNGQDFIEQFERFHIPVAKVIRQSERMDRYEEVNKECFGGRLNWEASAWQSISLCLPLPTIGSWGSWGANMALLSRVVDDHDFGVRQIFMGTELAFHSRAYALMWDLIFGPVTAKSRRPQLHYRPEVTERLTDLDQPDRKISKSVSWGKFLRNIDVSAWRFACGISQHQINQADQVLDWNNEDWDGLWTLWYGARWSMNPPPIEEGEIETWR